MGKITLGVCTSHSPMLSTRYEEFDGHAGRDAKNPNVPDFDGLLARNSERMVAELTPEVTRARFEETQEAIDRLHQIVLDSGVDVMVVVGDDQGEWFDRDDMPALAIYWGDHVENRPPSVDHMSPSLRSAYWGIHGDGTNRSFPVDAELGGTLVHELTERGFDVHQIRRQPDKDVPFGHAWGFVHQRIMRDAVVPIVPVMLNTYFRPNQPRPARCWDLGEAIREVIEAIPDDKKVAIVGSGGMSHFVVNEALDRQVLEYLGNNDRAGFEKMHTDDLQAGDSEMRNWIVAGGAASHLKMEVISYVPYYRSLAGTGCAMGFAVWS